MNERNTHIEMVQVNNIYGWQISDMLRLENNWKARYEARYVHKYHGDFCSNKSFFERRNYDDTSLECVQQASARHQLPHVQGTPNFLVLKLWIPTSHHLINPNFEHEKNISKYANLESAFPTTQSSSSPTPYWKHMTGLAHQLFIQSVNVPTFLLISSTLSLRNGITRSSL